LNLQKRISVFLPISLTIIPFDNDQEITSFKHLNL